MRAMIRSWVVVAAALVVLDGRALAQAAAAHPQAFAAQPQPPAAVLQTAPRVAVPRANDTNAERAISQPGNNAPFWRGVRDSGNQPGVIALPGPEYGVLIQAFTQYPGSSFTTAGEAWRQLRNDWIVPY